MLGFLLFWQMQVFGLYFMQSYIGLFYHASLHRNIMALRQVLIKRLIVSQACLHCNYSIISYNHKC
mgnify:CR=1 FL=1|jgi:hypothetical protein